MKPALFVLLLLMSSPALAQHDTYKNDNLFDVGISGAGNEGSIALSWVHLYGIGKGDQRLKLGYGARFTHFVAANKFYTTAPSKFTSTRQSLGTIFSKTIESNIDTVATATGVTNSLNVSINIEYKLASRFDIGFNIDAIGFSFGPKKAFNVISDSYDPNQSPVQRASPTSFNLLLTSDNDIGSLNSELYLRYWLSKTIGLRTGYTFLFSEYSTDRSLSFDNSRIVNDRYRYKAGMFLVAITYQPFRQ